jgi:hypothetical protein
VSQAADVRGIIADRAGEKLAFDLFSWRNYRDTVKQRFVCGRAHSIPHDIHYRCTTGPVGMIAMRDKRQHRLKGIESEFMKATSNAFVYAYTSELSYREAAAHLRRIERVFVQ